MHFAGCLTADDFVDSRAMECICTCFDDYPIQLINQAIIAFFKPSLFTLIILGIFIPVAVFGQIQTYGFTYDYEDRFEHPPPPLYDQIADYPFWLIWVFSILPLIPLTNVVQNSFPSFEGMIYVFMAMNFIYYYLASCVLRFVWRRFRPRKGVGTVQARS